MAARVAGGLYFIQLAKAQAGKPGNAPKGAEMAEVFGNQPAREGFIICQAPIRGRFQRVRLMRLLHQHQRMAGAMGGEHHAEKTGECGEGAIRVLLQGNARIFARPFDFPWKQDGFLHGVSPFQYVPA